MKKMYFHTIALALFLFSLCQSEAGYINITDPNSSWYHFDNDIKACSLFVSPKGLYCQYDLEMEVGVKNYSNYADSLEIHYQLNLPTSWTINDSWLWVGDTIVPAMLIDRARATEIYESLVSRRTDPSLLTWDTYGSVNLRVYPLFAGQSRRFRISFLAPTDWSLDNVTTEIAASILPNNLSKLDVLIRENAEFKFSRQLLINNVLVDANAFTRDTIESMVFSKYSITNPNGNGSITTKFERMNKSNVFFDIYQKNNEKYYQMALLHPDLTENRPMKKVLFAYDLDKQSEEFSQTRSKLATSMNNILNAKDSFNLLLSAYQNKFVFDKWMPATQENLDSAIHALNNHSTNSLTYFHNTMMSIIDFVKNENEFDVSSVMLLSSDMAFASAEKAMDEYSILKQTLNYKVKVNIALFYECPLNAYYSDYYYAGNYYRMNELLCKNISAYTQGMMDMDIFHQKYDYTTYTYKCDNIMPLFEAYYNQNIYGTNVQIQMQDGFSYTDNIIASNHKYTLMCGKLYGESDIVVKLTGFDGITPFIKSFNVPYRISEMNLRNYQFWAFKELSKLQKEQQSKSIKEEIVRLSTKNRVISQYTAFLALEPWMMNIKDKYSYTDAENNNENGGGDMSGIEDPTNSLEVNLNYNSQDNIVTLNIENSDENLNIEKITFYDISGKELQQWQITDDDSEINLTWQVSDAISNGTIIVIIETNNGTVTKKINIVK